MTAGNRGARSGGGYGGGRGWKILSATLNRSKCKVTGADFVSAKALDDSSLQVKADYRPVTVLGDTQKAGWAVPPRKRPCGSPWNTRRVIP